MDGSKSRLSIPEQLSGELTETLYSKIVEIDAENKIFHLTQTSFTPYYWAVEENVKKLQRLG